MIRIPLNGRIIWPGTNATIPANWSEDTNFTDRYFQGSDENFAGSANGGSATHGHTSNAHAHTGVAHRHSNSAGVSSGGSDIAIKKYDIPTALIGTGRPHAHNSATGNYTAITYQNKIISITARAAYPPSIKIIIIKPDNANQKIPDNAVCFTDETILPNGFSKTNGAGSTPDFDDRYFKGVDNNGDDSDIGGFGNTTHIHTVTGHNHIQEHVHSEKNCGSTTVIYSTARGRSNTYGTTHHLIGLKAETTTTSTDSTNSYTGSSLPEYIKILGIQNTSGGLILPKGVIILFTGDITGGAPSGWNFCDGNNNTPDLRNKQIMSTKDNGEIGDTGGSATHPHTINHGHTGENHNHTESENKTEQTVYEAGIFASENSGLSPTHQHTWTITSTTPTLQDTVATMSSDDTRYNYRTVVFIKYVGVTQDIIHSKGVITYAR